MTSQLNIVGNVAAIPIIIGTESSAMEEKWIVAPAPFEEADGLEGCTCPLDVLFWPQIPELPSQTFG